MSQPDEATKARLRQAAEHRLIVQATMQAKRAGKLPGGAGSSGAEAMTAVVVIVVVLGLLFLVMRYGA